MEAASLGFFMISACFFGGLLWSDHSAIAHWIPVMQDKFAIMGFFMGLTALGIFYSPWTNKSGAQMNPAVTITFLRLARMCRWDAFFYILFQCMGGTLAVFIMKQLMGNLLTDPQVNYVVTVPGKYGIFPAVIMEFITAFIMMTMVLFTSAHKSFSKYTRILAATLVCSYVMIAGPVSGFGMNPARTFASALPANTWDYFWLYLIMPLAGMLTASEVFLVFRHAKTATCFHTPEALVTNK